MGRKKRGEERRDRNEFRALGDELPDLFAHFVCLAKRGN